MQEERLENQKNKQRIMLREEESNKKSVDKFIKMQTIIIIKINRMRVINNIKIIHRIKSK